jgi:hypothetical protein
MSSLTIELLKTVGSPFTTSDYNPSPQSLKKLYSYATKNRMPLLYLESLRKHGDLGSLQEEHKKLIDRYTKTERAIARISKVLQESGIDYVLFKSVRPYMEVTVDIDALIFGHMYKEALRIIRSAGYRYLGGGPLSTTFRDDETRINMDIYNEVGVSYVIYLDKYALAGCVSDRVLLNGALVRSLSSESDLLAVIAHSIIKEHMYVLSEYYTTLYYLAEMNQESLESFLFLANRCKINSSVKTHLGITALLHYEAHQTMPERLIWLLEKLHANSLELSRVSEDFFMPHKYHPLTIIKALQEKLGEGKARRSFAYQTMRALNPKFAYSLAKDVLHHISRETY